MPDIAVCIASRGNPLGLWATIHASEAALAESGLTVEYHCFINGQKLSETHHLLKDKGVHVECMELQVSPPIARDFLGHRAKADVLFFFDDHVIPVMPLFVYAHTQCLQETDVLHFSYQPYLTGDRYYHFVPSELPTKGDYAKVPLSDYPYDCLSGPHGGFAVRKSAWDSLGGYGDWFQGFGGEEAYFGLKARKAGFKVKLDPRLLFYHFSCRPETRGYSKEINHWNYEEGIRQLGEVQLDPRLWTAH